MFHKRLRKESGYSLVETLAAMVLLTLAIIPMVGMFDTGLRGTTASGNFEKARALANLKMEEAKSLPFDSTDDAIQDVKDNFPELPVAAGGTVTPYDGSGHYIDVSDPQKTEPGFPNSMTYVIEKQYMAPLPVDPGNPEDFRPCPNLVDDCTPPTNLIRVTVTVNWDGNTYKTFGLVAE